MTACFILFVGYHKAARFFARENCFGFGADCIDGRPTVIHVQNGSQILAYNRANTFFTSFIGDEGLSAQDSTILKECQLRFQPWRNTDMVPTLSSVNLAEQSAKTYISPLWVPVHKERGPWWAMVHPNKTVSLKRACNASNKTEKEFLELNWEMKKVHAVLIPRD